MNLMSAFGAVLAVGVAATSAAMIVMGGRWQRIEAGVYGGARLPRWFVVTATSLVVLYLVALVQFIAADDKTSAGWILALLIPVGWALKAAIVVLRPAGREKVSGISGDRSWTMIGLARLPLAAVLAVLAVLA